MNNKAVHMLAIAPHPFDNDWGMAGTIARWVRKGKDTVYVICTNGDKGTSNPDWKPEELAVYGDKAYANEGKKREYEAKGIERCINRKANRGQQLTQKDKDYNHRQSQIRAKGEHAFLVVKHLWHYQRVRYKGLYKNAVQVFSLFTLANLYLVRHDLRMMGA